jgi:hypothetical protein
MNTRKRRRLTRPKGPPDGACVCAFPQGEYEALDKWTGAHVESLPQAVRRLVERGLRRVG